MMRRQVLQTLRDSGGGMTVASLAERLDIHPNTARFHIDTLIDRGQVEQEDASPAGRGRPPKRYKAVAVMDPAGPRQYQFLAQVLAHGLADAPDANRRAEDAGRAWGEHWVEDASSWSEGVESPAERLTMLLDEFGFAPERASSHTLGLRQCPFLELAHSQRQIVCSVHLGLMQGALSAMESTVTVTGLEPFVEPDLCVAHLATQGEHA